jgi:FkbM family methyltransferase
MRDAVYQILRHPRIEPYVSAWLRGRLVRESARFAIREARDAKSTHVYRIRESGLCATIEHGTPDVLTLDEIFYQHVYEPPDAIRTKLGAHGRPLRAVDLGANIGLWGLWLRGRFPVAQVTALEPDARNAASHRRQISLNHLERSWNLVQAAATCSDGPVAFTVGQATTGHIGEEGEPGTVTVTGIDVFPLIAGIDVLKLDIEGAEWPILSDPRFVKAGVPVVVLEYHPQGAPSSYPEEDMRRILAGAGYTSWRTHAAHQGTGIMWGLRT